MVSSENQPSGALFVGKGKAEPLPKRRRDLQRPGKDTQAAGSHENGEKIGGSGSVTDETSKPAEQPEHAGEPVQEPLFGELPLESAAQGKASADSGELRAAASLLPLKIHGERKTKKLDFELTLTERMPEDPVAEGPSTVESTDSSPAPGPLEAGSETTQDAETVAVARKLENPDTTPDEDTEDEEFSMVLPAGAKALTRGSPDLQFESQDYQPEPREHPQEYREPLESPASEQTGEDTLSRLADHPAVEIIQEDRINRKKMFLAAALAVVALLTALGAYFLWGKTAKERRDLLVTREIVVPDDGSEATANGQSKDTTSVSGAGTETQGSGIGQDGGKNQMVEDSVATPSESAGKTDTASPAAAHEVGQETAQQPSTSKQSDTDSIDSQEPVVDIVRIDADGNVVIAGQATPNADLIVLDNNEPIGKTTTDEHGEWVFAADHKLPPGTHEFGLVVKDASGRVILGKTLVHEIEAPPEPPKDLYEDLAGGNMQSDAEGEGAIDDGTAAEESDLPVPLPKPKPDTPEAFLTAEETPAVPQVVDYVIQLASVSSREGAEEEWAKLKETHKSILRPLTLIVDSDIFETKFRVRTGPFEKIEEAGEICKALKSSGQDCLVVKRVDGID